MDSSFYGTDKSEAEKKLDSVETSNDFGWLYWPAVTIEVKQGKRCNTNDLSVPERAKMTAEVTPTGLEPVLPP